MTEDIMVRTSARLLREQGVYRDEIRQDKLWRSILSPCFMRLYFGTQGHLLCKSTYLYEFETYYENSISMAITMSIESKHKPLFNDIAWMSL